VHGPVAAERRHDAGAALRRRPSEALEILGGLGDLDLVCDPEAAEQGVDLADPLPALP
jgi:hypothetical protein